MSDPLCGLATLNSESGKSTLTISVDAALRHSVDIVLTDDAGYFPRNVLLAADNRAGLSDDEYRQWAQCAMGSLWAEGKLESILGAGHSYPTEEELLRADKFIPPGTVIACSTFSHSHSEKKAVAPSDTRPGAKYKKWFTTVFELSMEELEGILSEYKKMPFELDVVSCPGAYSAKCGDSVLDQGDIDFIVSAILQMPLTGYWDDGMGHFVFVGNK